MLGEGEDRVGVDCRLGKLLAPRGRCGIFWCICGIAGFRDVDGKTWPYVRGGHDISRPPDAYVCGGGVYV